MGHERIEGPKDDTRTGYFRASARFISPHREDFPIRLLGAVTTQSNLLSKDPLPTPKEAR